MKTLEQAQEYIDAVQASSIVGPLDPFSIFEHECFGVQLGVGHVKWFGKSQENRDKWLAELLAGPRCKECTGTMDMEYEDRTKAQMQARQLCFKCNFWTNILVTKDDGRVFIDARAYSIGDEPGPSQKRDWLGFGGREFVIEFNDGRVVTTHNLWHQGIVPAHFRDRMPDTAKFRQYPKPIGHGQGYLG